MFLFLSRPPSLFISPFPDASSLHLIRPSPPRLRRPPPPLRPPPAIGGCPGTTPMARALLESLIRESHALIRGHPPAFHLRFPHLPSSRFLNLRGRSGRPEKLVQIFEVDLEPEGAGGASPEAAAARREAAARRLEDVIHGIVVRRAAPDWLPFIPGSSYWVPPRARSRGLAELLGRVSNPLTEEEVMSLTTVRGWPCSAHLMGDVSPDVSENSPKEDSVTSEDED